MARRRRCHHIIDRSWLLSFHIACIYIRLPHVALHARYIGELHDACMMHGARVSTYICVSTCISWIDCSMSQLHCHSMHVLIDRSSCMRTHARQLLLIQRATHARTHTCTHARLMNHLNAVFLLRAHRSQIIKMKTHIAVLALAACLVLVSSAAVGE